MSGRLSAKMIRFSELGEEYEAMYADDLASIRKMFPASTGVEWIGIDVSEAGAYFSVQFKGREEIRIGNQDGDSLDRTDDPRFTGVFYGGYSIDGDPVLHNILNMDVAYLARKLYTNRYDN